MSRAPRILAGIGTGVVAATLIGWLMNRAGERSLESRTRARLRTGSPHPAETSPAHFRAE